jgi:hypothetical protein
MLHLGFRVLSAAVTQSTYSRSSSTTLTDAAGKRQVTMDPGRIGFSFGANTSG